MDTVASAQKLFQAITYFYHQNHDCSPFGIEITSSGDVQILGLDEQDQQKITYCREAWRAYFGYLMCQLSSKALDLRGHRLYNFHHTGRLDAQDEQRSGPVMSDRRILRSMRVADARIAATQIILKEAEALFPNKVEHILSGLIATITKQYRDPNHKSWMPSKVRPVTEPLVQALHQRLASAKKVPRRAAGQGRNDGRSSEFHLDWYRPYEGDGPDWFDQHLFGAGQCSTFAAVLSKAKGWSHMREIDPGDFLDRNTYHCWALNDEGKAVDIWGERNTDWAAGYLHKKLAEPFGKVIDATNWANANHDPKLKAEARRIINSNLAFYGLSEPITA